jgi:Ca2+-binding RTX toxin-like protein
MFEHAKQSVKLVKVSIPMENHGKDYKMATVLTIQANMPNTTLRHFGAGLLEAIYRKAEPEEESEDLASDPDALNALRYPKMSGFDWDVEGTGYTATVAYGIGGTSDIEMIDAKVGSFHIQPMQGGTIQVSYNVTAHPDELSVGRLGSMQKGAIDLTLTAPDPTTVQELFPAE